jgi:ATP-dependent RNA helicase RhlE
MPFSGLGLHASLQKGLKELGFARPTPIQASAIPPAIEGRDVVACAMTGSGKTAAFLLPIAHRLMEKPRGKTRALVLTPTRELAAQILEDLNDLCVHTPITGAAVYGGVGMGPQEHALRSGVDVIVATPGRLLDHLRFPYAKLDRLEHLVLDEADRMLDMGFLPDIRRILSQIPAKRQTLLFSATMPPPIAALAKDMLRSPASINVGRQAAPAVGITQAIYPVRQDLKSALLLSLLERNDVEEALVFTRTKHRADRLARYLVKNGVRAERIHGNRSQAQRTAALKGFKDGDFRVLVATDIAARGIDIEELGHVINFDIPMAPEDYIHRVGRTARAEAVGDAFTFVAPDDEAELRAIERAIGKPLRRVFVPDFDYDARVASRLELTSAERRAERRAAQAGSSGGRAKPPRSDARRAGHSSKGVRRRKGGGDDGRQRDAAGGDSRSPRAGGHRGKSQGSPPADAKPGTNAPRQQPDKPNTSSWGRSARRAKPRRR